MTKHAIPNSAISRSVVLQHANIGEVVKSQGNGLTQRTDGEKFDLETSLGVFSHDEVLVGS